MNSHRCHDAPSAWVAKWATLIRKTGAVLDLACGAGRHSLLLAQAGFQVTAVDRDIAGVVLVAQHQPGIMVEQHDLEATAWPYDGLHFAGVVVTNYLHRPLLPLLITALEKPGGVLIYETFAFGNERFGRPSNPNFLLQPGELLELARAWGLRVIAYEDVEVDKPKPAMIQRICAVVA